MGKLNFTYQRGDGSSARYNIVEGAGDNYDIEFLETGFLTILSGTIQIDTFICGAGKNGTPVKSVWDDGAIWRGGNGGDGGGRLTKRGVILSPNQLYKIVIGTDGGASSAFGFTSVDADARVAHGGINGYDDETDPEWSKGEDGAFGGYAYEEEKGGVHPGTVYGSGGGGGGMSAYRSNPDRFWDYPGGKKGSSGAGYGGDGVSGYNNMGVRVGSDATVRGCGGGAGGGGDQISRGIGYGMPGIVMIRNARIGNSSYRITMDHDEGSNIVVDKISGANGTKGILQNNWIIYTDDILKIKFLALENYKLISTTVNGSTFTSENTHTVKGNVNVVARSQPLASEIYAPNSNLGEPLLISLTRYDNTYTHDIFYKFKSSESSQQPYSGTISTGVKADTISWTPPISFSNIIPNEAFGQCTLTCNTYSNGTLLGVSTCDIKLYVDPQKYAPAIDYSVVDTNPITSKLTGDTSKFILGKSEALCKLNAYSKNYSTLEILTIAEVVKSAHGASDSFSISIDNYDGSDIYFNAIDSRKYKSTKIFTPSSVVNYINLSCYAQVQRISPTSGDLNAIIYGDIFNGSFGAYDNTLMVDFRYRENTTDSQFTKWYRIPSDSFVLGKNSYQSTLIHLNSIIGDGTQFDYKKSYELQIRASDGIESDRLSYAIASENGAGGIIINKGMPVFDWGENDFNFSVPIKINGVSLFDIIYPIGSVYISVNDTSPAVFVPDSEWEKIEDRFILGAGSKYSLGSIGGESEHILTIDEMPAHQHASNSLWVGSVGNSDDSYVAMRSVSRNNQAGHSELTGIVGGGQSHNNMPPYIALNIWKRIS